MYSFKYGSARGKKIWINAHNKIDADNWINIAIELNPIDNINKINYIVKQSYNKKDEFIETLGIEEDKRIIDESIKFAENKGYINKVITRYNNKIKKV